MAMTGSLQLSSCVNRVPSTLPEQQSRDEIEDTTAINSLVTVKVACQVVELTSIKKDGFHIIDGDILVPPQQLPIGMGHATAEIGRLWDNKCNNGTSVCVPYIFDSDFKYQSRAEEAMSWWNENTIVEFTPRQNESDYLIFTTDSTICKYACSYVGSLGQAQKININLTNRTGNIAHELGHALGLYHMQSRSDRDDFVVIDDRCQNNTNFKFAKLRNINAEDRYDYDLYSIMHYSDRLLSGCLSLKDGIRQSLNLPTGIPGQRDSLSASDINVVNELYSEVLNNTIIECQ